MSAPLSADVPTPDDAGGPNSHLETIMHEQWRSAAHLRTEARA
jgi:hypothetical protein